MGRLLTRWPSTPNKGRPGSALPREAAAALPPNLGLTSFEGKKQSQCFDLQLLILKETCICQRICVSALCCTKFSLPESSSLAAVTLIYYESLPSRAPFRCTCWILWGLLNLLIESVFYCHGVTGIILYFPLVPL